MVTQSHNHMGRWQFFPHYLATLHCQSSACNGPICMNKPHAPWNRATCYLKLVMQLDRFFSWADINRNCNTFSTASTHVFLFSDTCKSIQEGGETVSWTIDSIHDNRDASYLWNAEKMSHYPWRYQTWQFPLQRLVCTTPKFILQ